MKAVLLVGFGGALGSAARYLVGIVLGRWLGTGFPWGVFSVNLIGCFLIGAFTALFNGPMPASNGVRLFLTAGFLGGFTTFSSFGLDIVKLAEDGKPEIAFLYIAGSLVLGYAGVRLGAALVRLWG